MKQMYKRMLAAAMALALMMALAVFHASAVDEASFDCFLIADERDSIPAVTFTYSIAPGDAVDGDGTTPAVAAGITEGMGELEVEAAFTGDEDTYDTVQSGDAISLASGKKYAKKTVSVDFSGVSFPQSGIYRYVITQSADNNTVDCDTQVGDDRTAGKRYLDVYVVEGDPNPEISAYVLYEVKAADDSASDKSASFVNELPYNGSSIQSYSLTFGKEVTGNQASPNKYFKFTLSLGSLTANDSYTVDLTRAQSAPAENSVTSYSSMSNPGSVQADGDGSVSVDFYLKDGQYISIASLPEGFTYGLSEVAEGYTSSPGIAADDNASNEAYPDDVTNDTGVHDNIKTGFTNSRNGVVPTGILLTVTPFVVGMFLFGALFVYMMARKRRRD